MRAAKRATEICVEVKFPERFVSFDEQCGLGHPGVVHDYVGTAAKVRAKTVESLVHRFSLLHVTLQCQRVSSEFGGNFLRDRFTSSSVRAATATPAPSAAKASAIARPMPRPPPVMNASLFASFIATNLECGGKRQRDTALDRRSTWHNLIQSAVAASLCRRTPNSSSA